MSDIVERLLAYAQAPVIREAADRIERLEAEVARLRAAQREVAMLRDQAISIPSGDDPKSFGDGFATAHQMVLNILNRSSGGMR